MKKWFGCGMLLLAAIVWGVAFVAQSVGMDYVEPFTFNFARYYIGSAVLLPYILMRFLGKKRQKEALSEKEGKSGSAVKHIWGGIGCGLLLFIASTFQQFGIKYSEIVGKAGFITALYIILVPVMGLFIGKKTRAFIWICVALSVIGLYLLCMTNGFALEKGDILLLLCALFFTFHIMFIDYVSPHTDGVIISCIQFATAGVLCTVAALIWEEPKMADILRAYIPILYAGACSCGIGYTFQILGQKYVEPAKASLILCLESVISVLAGWILLPNQALSIREITGCLIMFTAIILAQFVQKNEEEHDREAERRVQKKKERKS